MSKARRQTAKGHPHEMTKRHRFWRFVRPRVGERYADVSTSGSIYKYSRILVLRTHRDAPLSRRARMGWWIAAGAVFVGCVLLVATSVR